MAATLNIALYSPYVPEHVGGGERYFFQVAATASKLGHKVTVLLRTHSKTPDEVRKKYSDLFGFDLNAVQFTQTSIGTSASFWKKLKETAAYDVFYYVTDGSLFFSLAKKNILHIQFPFSFPMKGLLNRIKLSNWSLKNSNSQFTRNVIQRFWNTTVQYVHYPCVDTTKFVPQKKEHIILSVGRFFSGEQSKMHCKRQDVMVDAFRSLSHEPTMKGWKLILAGDVDPGLDNEQYARNVAKSAAGYPIEILHKVSFSELLKLYGSASLYWHAAGYGVDENIEPTKVEHFGIAPLEAMSAGAVPLVVAKGGLPEIVENQLNGYLWDTISELQRATLHLAEDVQLRQKMSLHARERAEDFGVHQFEQVLKEMLSAA